MNTDETTSRYLLLIRGTDWESKLSPEEIQQFMEQFTAWLDGLNERNVIESSHPLGHEGRIVSGRDGQQTVSDGPFAESKEAVGGFFLLNVKDFDEAMAIAESSPMVAFGGAVEVRPVIAQCSTMERAGAMAARNTG